MAQFMKSGGLLSQGLNHSTVLFTKPHDCRGMNRGELVKQTQHNERTKWYHCAVNTT